MSTEQGCSRNKVNIKKITLYALLVSLCLIVGYLENLLSIVLTSLAPGIKIGLSNAVALLLICTGDKRGAWAVNITRVCLSALLFGSPISFLFSMSGAVVSTLLSCLLCQAKSVSAVGVSIAAGTVHNIAQCVAAAFFVGFGVVYYMPALILFGALAGGFCGTLVMLLQKHTQKIFNI